MRHLRCLIAVAEELHFGRAATRLNISQPPVSLAIKELEAELGVTLFERNSRRIVLTRQGEEAVHDARAVLARTELLKRRAHDSAQGQSGTLSRGFISLAPYSFTAGRAGSASWPTSRRSRSRCRSFDHRTRSSASSRSSALDLGFIFASPGMSKTLAYRPRQRDPLIVALPATHALAKSAQVPLEKLSRERFLGFERQYGPMIFDAIVATCMRHGFSPDLFPARQMQHDRQPRVGRPRRRAVVPASVKAMPREGVVYRPIKGERTLVETGAAWREADESLLVQSFMDYLPRAARAG